MPSIPFISSRPGKTKACHSNGDTFNLKELVQYGQSVAKNRKKGAPAPVLVVKSKRSLFGGKRKESLSVHPKGSPSAISSSPEETAARLKRTLERRFAGGLQYSPQVNEIRAEVWRRLVGENALVFDDDMLTKLAFLAEAKPVDTSPTLPRMFASAMANRFAAWGCAEDANKIGSDMTVRQLAKLVQALPEARQHTLEQLLQQTAIQGDSEFEAAAAELLKALNWPAAKAQTLLADKTASTSTSASPDAPEGFTERPEPSSAPLGLAFAIAFQAGLTNLDIDAIPPVDRDTTIDELAGHIRGLPPHQRIMLKKPLQTATQQAKPELANTAAKLLKAMGWPVPVDALPEVEGPPSASARVDAPAKDAGANQIGWPLMNALQGLNVEGLSGLTPATSVRELTQAVQAMQGTNRTAVEERLRLIQQNAHGSSSDIAQQVLSDLGAQMPADPVSAPSPVEVATKPAAAPRDERLDFPTANGINQALRKEGVAFPEVSMHTTVAQFIQHLNLHPEAKPVVLAHLAVLPNHPTLRKGFIDLSARIQAEVL